jgi:hypothetical protein
MSKLKRALRRADRYVGECLVYAFLALLLVLAKICPPFRRYMDKKGEAWLREDYEVNKKFYDRIAAEEAVHKKAYEEKEQHEHKG